MPELRRPRLWIASSRFRWCRAGCVHSFLLEASHREHIDELSSAIGIANQCALNGKAKPLVQLNGCFVIGINLQLKPQKVQPLIPQVDGRLQECRADALTVKLITDRHTYLTRMTTARAIRKSMNIQLPDQLSFEACHQSDSSLGWFCHSLAPHLGRGKGQLKRSPNDLGPCKYVLNRFVVIRLGRTD